MYKYFKKLNYPVNVKKKDLKMAKYLITQLGGPAGELGAALRYFSQKFAMPDKSLCGDNGAMIALAGYYEYKKGNFADTYLNASAYSPLD